MTATIEPEPPDGERDAILAALGSADEDDGWARGPLEGVEDGDLDP